MGTHGENCKKNVVGEFTSSSVDKLVGEMLNEYGNVFNIHAHAFIVDANASNSASLKAFKAALSDIKTEIIDVSLPVPVYDWDHSVEKSVKYVVWNLHLRAIIF